MDSLSDILVEIIHDFVRRAIYTAATKFYYMDLIPSEILRCNPGSTFTTTIFMKAYAEARTYIRLNSEANISGPLTLDRIIYDYISGICTETARLGIDVLARNGYFTLDAKPSSLVKDFVSNIRVDPKCTSRLLYRNPSKCFK